MQYLYLGWVQFIKKCAKERELGPCNYTDPHSRYVFPFEYARVLLSTRVSGCVYVWVAEGRWILQKGGREGDGREGAGWKGGRQAGREVWGGKENK